MWDFDLGKALSAMRQTLPFVLFRMAIYFAITLAYILGTGVGAGVGYGVTAFGDNPGSGAGLGAMIGFGAVGAVVYWVREYLLYLVKAAHISALLDVFEGKPVAGGQSQVTHAQQVIKENFKEASILFGVDQLVKGVLGAINRLLLALTSWLPIPGLQNLMAFITRVVEMSLTYVDEIIIAYHLRTGGDNPWQSCKTALVLYAQNYKTFLRNALFLTLFMYLLAFLVFLVVLGPVAGLMSMFPGQVGGFSFIVALVLAWSIKAALLEPVAIYALMQVFFKVTEGQQPNPEWEAKLDQASDKFRELKDQALSHLGGAKTS
ncbi:MAG: hypothetical protein IPM37_20115 [Hahellaceae bacterium]|jgi:hypothetical protein|nr:hypothetical protein [Hahellaceae bacterium]